MSKRRKNKNKKELPRIDDPILKQTAFDVAKTHKTVVPEKVEPAPQTYIEDTFEIGNENLINDQKIIENEIKKKEKIMMDEQELLSTFSFKNKLNKIKVRVEFEKSFSFLFDYINATKLYKTYYINDIDDEYDLLLLHTVINFKKKLAKIQISYEVYNKFEIYFESLKNLYGRFKRSDNTEKPKLNLELKQIQEMSDEISYYFFK